MRGLWILLFATTALQAVSPYEKAGIENLHCARLLRDTTTVERDQQLTLFLKKAISIPNYEVDARPQSGLKEWDSLPTGEEWDPAQELSELLDTDAFKSSPLRGQWLAILETYRTMHSFWEQPETWKHPAFPGFLSETIRLASKRERSHNRLLRIAQLLGRPEIIALPQWKKLCELFIELAEKANQRGVHSGRLTNFVPIHHAHFVQHTLASEPAMAHPAWPGLVRRLLARGTVNDVVRSGNYGMSLPELLALPQAAEHPEHWALVTALALVAAPDSLRDLPPDYLQDSIWRAYFTGLSKQPLTQIGFVLNAVKANHPAWPELLLESIEGQTERWQGDYLRFFDKRTGEYTLRIYRQPQNNPVMEMFWILQLDTVRRSAHFEPLVAALKSKGFYEEELQLFLRLLSEGVKP